MNEKRVKIGVAWYKPEQWDRLREISVDRKDVEFTYEEWLKNAQKTLGGLLLSGLDIEKYEVDVEALLAWCKSKNIPVDGKARSSYVSEKVREKDIGG